MPDPSPLDDPISGMRLLIVSESPLDCVGGRYFAVDPWVRFITHMAARIAGVTLLAPVRQHQTERERAPDSWPLVPGRLRIEHLDPYNSYAGFAKLWWSRRRTWSSQLATLVGTHDAVVLRLPSPIIGLVMRAARKARKPAILLVAGNMVTQSDRIIGSGGLRRLTYSAIVRGLVAREVSHGRRAARVFAYSTELAERHARAKVRRMRTPHLDAGDIVERDDTCSRDEIHLLRVAWLLPSKGLETLLAAVALLAGRGLRVRLTFVGKERQAGFQDHLAREAGRLGIADRVTFRGWVPFDRIRDVYLESDIQVISSLAEATPRCILEGMAWGVPLVSTNVGGCRDVLRDGEDALLVPPGEPVAMADAIARLAADGALRRRIIKNGYEVARASTFEVLGRDFLDEVSRAIGAPA